MQSLGKSESKLLHFTDIVVQLAKHYQHAISQETLLHSFSSEHYSEAAAIHIADVAGFEMKRVSYSLSDISENFLPLVLELKNDHYAILLNIDQKQHRYFILDEKGNESWLSESELNSIYTGKAFLGKYRFLNTTGKTYKPQKKHWFWDSLRFSSSIYIDVFAATFLLNIFALLTPLFVRNVYDRVVPNAAFDTLYVLSSGIILIYLFDLIFRFLRTYLLESAGKKSDIIISSRLFEHILNMKLSHKFKSVGAFANNIKEFETLRNFLSSATLTMLIDLPFTIVFLFVIYLLAGKIMLVPLFAGIFIILYGLIIARPLKKHIDETSQLASWKNGVLIESLSALETIKSFGLHSMMQWRWEESVGEIAHTNMRTKILTTSMSTLTNFVVQISNVLVIILGVYAIHEKELTMGGLIAVTMLTSRALTPLVQISSLIVNYEYAKSSYNILNQIYHTPVERDQQKQYIAKEQIEGKIEFKNVSFSYPGTEDLVLDNISFIINPGEIVAILGTNGSGKSTLLRLIMGFHEPSQGMILIDGIDIRHIDPMVLRRHFNYIPQDIILFNASVKENIVYAMPKASEEMIKECTMQSNLNVFIEKNPLGYDFPVGERGSELSGGQKQLVGLSRFFLRKNSPLLLLDEPTNGLDAETEAIVLKNIQTFTHGKTVLIISHKRNMLQLVSRIIVLNKGKVAYDGERNEVLQKLS